MMAERDPYNVLGVSKGSTDAEIKRAFRKKARQFHPDRNPDNETAEAKFKEVQSAYEKSKDVNLSTLISGIDKQKVGQVAADIRSVRPPEPYKGKGIKYADEQIVKKEAKKK